MQTLLPSALLASWRSRLVSHISAHPIFLLLLPTRLAAQLNVFYRLQLGDNTTYCEGETACLNGGYDFYNEIGGLDIDPSILPGRSRLTPGTFKLEGITGTTQADTVFTHKISLR
jgi:hypothetical protein